ncbi:hypothetical protein T4D_11235 [Trichinella pseudospiralis]|uniref:Uncharacterized protein n=1 Tax=Trichinella pseudospiralis TaxID=6337 RepID=A0A0V1G522_TRIPS|nr:hypothetical protein T4D_11235 [Trichinella pseudospiralis]
MNIKLHNFHIFLKSLSNALFKRISIFKEEVINGYSFEESSHQIDVSLMNLCLCLKQADVFLTRERERERERNLVITMGWGTEISIVVTEYCYNRRIVEFETFNGFIYLVPHSEVKRRFGGVPVIVIISKIS